MSKISFVFIAFILYHVVNINSQWVYQQVPSNASHYITLEFPSTQIGTVGGAFASSTNFSGRGAYTTNGGNMWLISQVPDSARVLAEIKFVNTTTGYCVGAYNQSILSRPIQFVNYDMRTFQSLSGHFGVNGDYYKGLFLKTTNSGQSWFTYGTLPANVYYLTSLHFVNSTTAFATASYDFSGGVNDGVIKTTNAGLSWQILTMPENINNLNDIYFTDLNSGYAVGYDEVNDTAKGLILKTTNSGLSWTRQIFPQIYQFNGVHFSNSSTGIVVGGSILVIDTSGTKVYRTTNAGLNWTNVVNYTNTGVFNVSFVQGTGTALIYGNKIFQSWSREFISRTTNYGNSWTEGVLNDTELVLLDAELLSQSNWYLTGGDISFLPGHSVILHTTNGGSIGITTISNETPDRYALSQNYPNPFNPVTKIRFSLPNTSEGGTQAIKLIIYDILGREIATLVNEKLKPGTYEVDWDANAFASGVYFYSLIVGDNTNNWGEFVETKKMILIK